MISLYPHSLVLTVKEAEGPLLTSLNTEFVESEHWTVLQLCVKVQPQLPPAEFSALSTLDIKLLASYCEKLK